jgi:hypothetical protein
VCTHPERHAIDRALVERGGYRAIAREFGLGHDAVIRHTAAHLPATLATSYEASEQLRADDLVGRLLELHDETIRILEEARTSKNHDLALKAIARAEKQIELQARLLGELKDGVTINLFQSAEWFAVVTKLLTALDPYPDVKVIVAEVLERADH